MSSMSIGSSSNTTVSAEAIAAASAVQAQLAQGQTLSLPGGTQSAQSISSSNSQAVSAISSSSASVVVSDMMNADLAAYNQGIKNTNDAASLSQTAEGSMQVINKQLIRMQELAMQSSNGIYSAAQRSIIDAEYQMMAEEITRIANATEFNGRKLLDGSLEGEYDGSNPDSTGEIKIHFGPNNDDEEDSYKLSIGSVTAESLGIGKDNGGGAGNNLLTQESSANSLESIRNAITKTSDVMAHLGAFQNRLESTSSHLEIQAENLYSSKATIDSKEEEERRKKFIQNQAITNPQSLMFAQANKASYMAYQYMN